MVRALILLLDLLTNYQAVESLARDVFRLGLASTGIACLFGGFEIVSRLKLHRGNARPSRSLRFENSRRHLI